MTKTSMFYTACFGFAMGVLIRSLWHFEIQTVLLSVFGALCILLARAAFAPHKEIGIFRNFRPWVKRADVWIRLLCIFTLACAIGIIRFHLADAPPPEFFETRVGEKINFSGIIVEEPVTKENDTLLTVATNAPHTKIILAAKDGNEYRYGDEIEVEGKLEKPQNFMTDQGKEFDYINYLRTDGILYTVYRPAIEIRSRQGGNSLIAALFSFKEKFTAALDSSIPAPEHTMLEGLILGERASFSQSLRQSFVTTGTIHIITIAGYHVAVVASWVMKLFGFLPLPFATGAGITSIFLYVIATGASQTAVRAGIMAMLALWARATGKLYQATRALVLAALIMIFINPLILVFDVSFELSFLATIAVIMLTPKIERYFVWIPQKRLRDIAAITCAMYIFVLPLILYKIGTLSLVALPTNLAIVPLVPLTMITGFVTGFTGLVSGILAWIPAHITYALLHYELAAIGFFAQLPFASLAIPNFPLALVLLVYAMFLWYLFVSPAPKLKPAELQAEWENRFSFVGSSKTTHAMKKWHVAVLLAGLLLTFAGAGIVYWRHQESNRSAEQNLHALLTRPSAREPFSSFTPALQTKSRACMLHDHLPDQACTPGAVFTDATVEQICVKGYTKRVRNVSTRLRQEIYEAYGIPYPQERGVYEVDHLIPLALGGSNESANLWTEAAQPSPGFHEKDLVEVYLQEEVCAGRVALAQAQRQIAADWLAVYRNLTPEQLITLKKKYGNN